MIIRIDIRHDAPAPDVDVDGVTSWEWDLMIDGLAAEIREIQHPGSNGIAQGVIYLDGDATDSSMDDICGLSWVDGVGT